MDAPREKYVRLRMLPPSMSAELQGVASGYERFGQGLEWACIAI